MLTHVGTDRRAAAGPPAAPATLDAVAVPVLVVGGDGDVIAANRALRRLVGLDDPVGGPARFLHRSPGWQQVWRYLEEGPDPAPRIAVLDDDHGRRRYLDVRVEVEADHGWRVATLLDVGRLRSTRQQLLSQSRLLEAARAQLEAARADLRRAESSFAEVVAELEALHQVRGRP